MGFLPLDDLTIVTDLSPEEAERRLSAVVFQCRSSFWHPWPREPFRGRVEGGSFRIARTIRYRNSWLPVLVGSIEPLEGRTILRVHMRLHRVVAAFTALWFGGLLLMICACGFLLATGHAVQGPRWALAIPFGMLGFAYALMSACFWLEAAKARSLLASLLNGTIHPHRNRSDPLEPALR